MIRVIAGRTERAANGFADSYKTNRMDLWTWKVSEITVGFCVCDLTSFIHNAGFFLEKHETLSVPVFTASRHWGYNGIWGTLSSAISTHDQPQ